MCLDGPSFVDLCCLLFWPFQRVRQLAPHSCSSIGPLILYLYCTSSRSLIWLLPVSMTTQEITNLKTTMVNFSLFFTFAAKVDLDNELVRHFLIETTKKGVRLKGYNDEPVFGKFWFNTTHMFDGIFAVNCSLLIN